MKATRSSNNNETLRTIIKEHGLTRSEVARLLYVNDSTVDRWLVKPTIGRKPNTTFRSMPDSRMRMLMMVLNIR